jgi:DNA-binding GntR family transcriptional regulator
MTNLGLNIPRAISLRQQVTDSLRTSILSGTLRPGQKLIERELCEEMHISRTVLREALQHLEAEGMIVNEPPKGRVVIDISEEEAREIYDVRRAMEYLVAESFIRNATEGQIVRLREKLNRAGSLARPEDILTLEDEFTSDMLRAGGNKVAANILLQLNNRIVISRRLSSVAGISADERLAELRALMSAIEARSTRGIVRAAAQ